MPFVVSIHCFGGSRGPEPSSLIVSIPFSHVTDGPPGSIFELSPGSKNSKQRGSRYLSMEKRPKRFNLFRFSGSAED